MSTVAESVVNAVSPVEDGFFTACFECLKELVRIERKIVDAGMKDETPEMSVVKKLLGNYDDCVIRLTDMFRAQGMTPESEPFISVMESGKEYAVTKSKSKKKVDFDCLRDDVERILGKKIGEI